MKQYGNFIEYLFEHSKLANNFAFEEKNTKVTYADYYSTVQNVIGFLSIQNFDPKTPILILSDNSFFSAATYLGIIGKGHIVVPLHPLSSQKMIFYVINSLKISCIVTQEKYIKKFHECPTIKVGLIDQLTKFTDASFEMYKLADFEISNDNKLADFDIRDHIATILFTSGSTGTPKGVMLSHNNLLTNTESIIQYLNLNHNDKMMEVLPYSYCYGASWLHTLTRVGGTNVINNRFMFMNKVLQEINDKKCTGFAGVPSHFQMLLRKSSLKELQFPSLRFIAQAGGKLANVFIKELIENLPDSQIYIMYGQTEATARLSYLAPEYLNTKLGSIGKGIPGVTLEILDKNGKRVKIGEIGNIVASGDNVMMGYWNDPQETSKTLIDKKLWTGDLAKYDNDGFIYIVDREKHFIKSGGHRISPKEIEDTIVELHDVIECAVIGIQDDILGEAPKAFIVPKNYDENHFEQLKQEIIKKCKEKLASFKIPKNIEFIKSLPKTSSNKILVSELKKIDSTKH